MSPGGVGEATSTAEAAARPRGSAATRRAQRVRAEHRRLRALLRACGWRDARCSCSPARPREVPSSLSNGTEHRTKNAAICLGILKDLGIPALAIAETLLQTERLLGVPELRGRLPRGGGLERTALCWGEASSGGPARAPRV